MTPIFHITPYKAWMEAMREGIFHPPSLTREGFIHCSHRDQLIGVANAMFHGEHGLVILSIDPDLVAAGIREEDCYETGRTFPHIYGSLNLDAVVDVVPFPPDTDGKFGLPPSLAPGVVSRRRDFPILEYDPSRQALIEPQQLIAPLNIASRCVLCFFQEVITTLRERERLTLVANLGSEIGHNPVFEIEVDGQKLTVCHPGVGAPMAAAVLEELIALGCRTFIICGGAGVLDSSLTVGHIVVPVGAVRDEGTSYHYLAPAREVHASPEAIAAIETVLERANVAYMLGKTWTTDGIYRETQRKVRMRRAEGCLTVEMEAAAFFAVSQFRDVTVGQLLYSGDDVSGEAWDSRHWQKRDDVREKLFWLAAEACLEL